MPVAILQVFGVTLAVLVNLALHTQTKFCIANRIVFGASHTVFPRSTSHTLFLFGMTDVFVTLGTVCVGAALLQMQKHLGVFIRVAGRSFGAFPCVFNIGTTNQNQARKCRKKEQFRKGYVSHHLIAVFVSCNALYPFLQNSPGVHSAWIS